MKVVGAYSNTPVYPAAKADYEGGYLFDVQALIKAEVLGDALEQATDLLNAGYKDPACVVIGVALETAVKEMCVRASVPHGRLDKKSKYSLCVQMKISRPLDK